MLRYLRNHDAISEAEQAILAQKRVLVVGCGGLGGYVIECLARIGVGYLRVVDGDVFDETNLNRQLLSSNMNLGRPKTLAAQQR
ncbi:MAG: HesA/MoeB/ThiF family protein, partial [Chloroflexi bacterium]|nr:HesA/MoeB/ThiF family protein [Chloroflexota bacterium]